MRIFEWLAELRFRNNLLYRIGLIHLILAFLLIMPLLVDERQVMGINAWIKPIKFCLSIWIYAWTFGWILFDLPNSRKWIRGISWTVAITMITEIGVIIYQASRATTSHFNFSTPFDSILFAIMGVMIGVNTIAIVVTFVLFLVKKPKLDSIYLMAMRMAFIVFLVGNWVGGAMIQARAHAVGVEDGGPGLPFTNWSTEGGDLRIAHFLGLHAIQIIPLFAYFLHKKTSLGLQMRRTLTIIFILVYAGLVSFLYQQAMSGKPLIPIS